MSKYFYIPYNSCRETKIQTMQYKLLHGIYPCRLKLFQWKIFTSNICLDCDMVDNLEHHFYKCQHMRIFWRSLAKWWLNICQTCTIDNELSVMLGIKNKNCHVTQLNYIILVAKWYIYRTKYLNDKCFSLDFLSELKGKIKCEESIMRRQNAYGKFINLWLDILTQF